MLHDAMDYTPYEGKMIKGWPVPPSARRNSRRRASSSAPPQGPLPQMRYFTRDGAVGRRTIAFDPETGSLESVREAENPH